jgi:hypothetical protein
MTFDRSGWRQGAACVAALTFNVDAESPILAGGRRYAENAMAMTHQAFGPKVGVPRILQMLKDVQLPATFFIPGVTAERYPHMVEQVLGSGHEIAHDSHTHRTVKPGVGCRQGGYACSRLSRAFFPSLR